MKLDKSNQWLALLANVGVVAGIIFLAFELQQNNKQLELQSYQSWVAANLEINAALTDPALSEIMARGHLNSTNLSNESFIAYAMLNMSVIQMAQSTDYLYRTAGILAFPGVRQWWEAGGRTQLTPGFVEFLESIESNIDTWSWDKDRGFFQDNGLIQSSGAQ